MKTTTALGVLAGLTATLAAAQLMAAAPAEIAQREYEEVLALTPNLENGRQAYLTCAVCHRPEGWGSPDGSYPQIAGQWRTVIIKQLADVRARNRDNPLMYPFSVPRILGGPQQIADVAAYLAQLPMTPHNGWGPGTDLEHGRALYQANCAECHGDNGWGNEPDHMPAVAGQHFLYLMRQFDSIRTGRRKNSDPEMVKQIEGFSPRDQAAVLDYTARLRPPPEKLARDGWLNPDFPNYVRPPMPEPPPIPAMPEPPPMPKFPEPPRPGEFPSF
ncbi:MAG: c-type cytochrome [Chromatiaceae bacterium]|jgi:cytochrome c553|nr:c-type cytochrome [Chromatiaceae bacterium]